MNDNNLRNGGDAAAPSMPSGPASTSWLNSTRTASTPANRNATVASFAAPRATQHPMTMSAFQPSTQQQQQLVQQWMRIMHPQTMLPFHSGLGLSSLQAAGMPLLGLGTLGHSGVALPTSTVSDTTAPTQGLVADDAEIVHAVSNDSSVMGVPVNVGNSEKDVSSGRKTDKDGTPPDRKRKRDEYGDDDGGDGSGAASVGDGDRVNVEESSEFFEGQIFSSEEEFDKAMQERMARTNERYSREKSRARRAGADYESILYRCRRSRKRKKKNELRPNQTSLKCDCTAQIRAAKVLSEDKKTRGPAVEVVKVDLTHTNGCKGGKDTIINECMERRSGRKYDEHVLNHLRREVRSGRYKTGDVQSYLVDSGLKDVTRIEATNLRYRLLKDQTIRGWKYDEQHAAEYAKQQDTLYNEDLAAEIEAGGSESLNNLTSLHRGLEQEEEGYDHRTATDSEGRFSGTAWRTGRMGGRLKKSGKAMLFMDDSRSGINTSGFCFWNLVIVDADGKVGVVLGAMTMSASAEAITWVLQCLKEMSGFDISGITVVMSDLGKTGQY